MIKKLPIYLQEERTKSDVNSISVLKAFNRISEKGALLQFSFTSYKIRMLHKDCSEKMENINKKIFHTTLLKQNLFKRAFVAKIKTKKV